MKIVLVAFGCMIAVGLVVFVALGPTQPTQTDIVSPRLEPSVVERPVVQGASQRVLEFFPDPEEMRELANVQPVVDPNAHTATSQPIIPDQSMDENRLLALIDDWVYVQYFQIGGDKKGRIHKSREDVMMDVTEGDVLENGITIQTLTSEQATLRLGEALFHMRLSREPEFFADLRTNPRPLSPEEQKKAYDYYMARYGDKFKMFSKSYKAPLDFQTPRHVTQQQQQQAIQQYMQQHGNQFQQERGDFPTSVPYSAEQRENFREYWQKTHPDKPMPNFEDVYRINELGPAERVQQNP